MKPFLILPTKFPFIARMDIYQYVLDRSSTSDILRKWEAGKSSAKSFYVFNPPIDENDNTSWNFVISKIDQLTQFSDDTFLSLSADSKHESSMKEFLELERTVLLLSMVHISGEFRVNCRWTHLKPETVRITCLPKRTVPLQKTLDRYQEVFDILETDVIGDFKLEAVRDRITVHGLSPYVNNRRADPKRIIRFVDVPEINGRTVVSQLRKDLNWELGNTTIEYHVMQHNRSIRSISSLLKGPFEYSCYGPQIRSKENEHIEGVLPINQIKSFGGLNASLSLIIESQKTRVELGLSEKHADSSKVVQEVEDILEISLSTFR